MFDFLNKGPSQACCLRVTSDLDAEGGDPEELAEVGGGMLQGRSKLGAGRPQDHYDAGSV